MKIRAGHAASAIIATLCLPPVQGTVLQTSPTARIFYVDIGGGGRVLSANPDGTGVNVISTSRAAGPDGIAVDAVAKQIYWTNMGAVSRDDGTIERSDLDGANGVTIVPAGGTFTPKQLKLDRAHGKLYWSDRKGMRVRGRHGLRQRKAAGVRHQGREGQTAHGVVCLNDGIMCAAGNATIERQPPQDQLRAGPAITVKRTA